MTPWRSRNLRLLTNPRKAPDHSVAVAHLVRDIEETSFSVYLESVIDLLSLRTELRRDPKLRGLAKVTIDAPEFHRQLEEAHRRRLPDADVEKLRAGRELAKQHIHVSPTYRRRPSSRCRAHVVSPTEPSSPVELVEVVTQWLGAPFAAELVRLGLSIVERTGDPAPWIVEIARARDCGDISRAVAHFLIQGFARSALTKLATTHPLLSRISRRLAVMERLDGIDKRDRWASSRGSVTYKALCEEWRAKHDWLGMDILVRHGEYEIAEAYTSDADHLYLLGYLSILGDLH